MSKQPKIKSQAKLVKLHSQLRLHSQSWYWESAWRREEQIEGFTRHFLLRIEIRRNAYDEQSFRKVEVFNPVQNAWNFLWALPFDTAHCKPVSYTGSNPKDKELFEADEADLLVIADKLLTH